MKKFLVVLTVGAFAVGSAFAGDGSCGGSGTCPSGGKKGKKDTTKESLTPVVEVCR